MNKLDFKKEYEKRICAIDEYIENFLESLDDIEPVLKDGMKYAVLNGGKRLRSIICCEICRCICGSEKAAMPYAAAIEFIHAYSLVHDDLPAMDNSDFRRGLPSCHKKFGEDIAILVGDALLNTAFDLMLAYSEKTTNGLDAMKIISKNSGICGMINGQMRDLGMLKKNVITKEDLLKLIEQKTMALIRGAALSGGLIAQADSKVLENIDKYAYHLGLAFQIRDDFEDFDEDEAQEHECPNFINIFGENKAKELLDYNIRESYKFLDALKNNEFLIALGNYLFPEVK